MAKLYVLNGPAKGRVFTLREGSSFLGRSLDNDVVIEDRTLSRKHLRVVQRANAFFVTDLKSRNGTFYKGDFVKAGVEIQIQEGSPIAVGMTVIGIGEGSEEEMMPLPEITGLVDTLKVLKIQSVMCIPLMRRSKVFGVIYVDSLSRPYGFRWDDLLLFSDFSRRLALVLENALYASQIMAAADALVSEEEED